MANLTITSANARLPERGTITQIQLGEAVGVSQPVYLNTTDSRWYKSIATSATAAAATAITLMAGDDEGFVPAITAGKYKPGATVVAGTPYYVSATSGLICLYSDLVSTNYVTYLGYGTTTDEIMVDINATGIQIA